MTKAKTKTGRAKKKSARKAPVVTLETVRELTLGLPGVEEGTSYGTPGFRVRKKLLARMWEDGQTLVARVEWDQRDTLLEMDPEAFFLTDHYRDHPWICIHLRAVRREALGEILLAAWRNAASKRQIAELEAALEKGAGP